DSSGELEDVTEMISSFTFKNSQVDGDSLEANPLISDLPNRITLHVPPGLVIDPDAQQLLCDCVIEHLNKLRYDDRAVDIIATIYCDALVGRASVNILRYFCQLHRAGVPKLLSQELLY